MARIVPESGIIMPAATNALWRAFSKTLSLPITSPVDFISGPRAISTSESLAKEKTGTLTAISSLGASVP